VGRMRSRQERSSYLDTGCTSTADILKLSDPPPVIPAVPAPPPRQWLPGPNRASDAVHVIVYGPRHGSFVRAGATVRGSPGRGLHSELNLRTFGNTSLTLELNLSTFGTHPQLNLGHTGDKLC
jgi:hypothetical protein